MRFNGEIKSGRIYTDEFKDFVRGRISSGLSLKDIVAEVGSDRIAGIAFSQLYYKLVREVNYGQDIKTMRSNHKGDTYNNSKDDGIKDEGAVFVDEPKASDGRTISSQYRSLLHEYSIKAKELDTAIDYKNKELDLLKEQQAFYNKICMALTSKLRSKPNE